MNDTIINTRQQSILLYLLRYPNSSHEEIAENLPKNEKPSRVTVSRDLKYLTDNGYVVSVGKTKGTVYSISDKKALFLPINIDEYYKKSQDERDISFIKFNLSIFDFIPESFFTEEELKIFETGKDRLSKALMNLDDIYVRKELERFTIELSWKSSQIEGNTYSLLETEELIRNKKRAKGHDPIEATMILNHKKAFDNILENRDKYKNITMHDIRTIHSVLVTDMNIPGVIREKAIGITGTKYIPIDNKWQIEEFMNKMISILEMLNNGPSKALYLLAMISYIQPFADGNKRTSRMISNAVLLANGYFPLSYRSVDEVYFKKALLMFYEQNNIYNLKSMFLDQQKFALETYFK